MRQLTQISFMAIISMLLAACSGGSSDPAQIPNPYAGLWIGKNVGDELRTNKDGKIDCGIVRSSTIIMPFLIDKNGVIYEYYIENSKEKLQKEGTITRDGKITLIASTEHKLNASLQGQELTLTVSVNGEATNLHYSKATKAEVMRLASLKPACTSELPPENQ